MSHQLGRVVSEILYRYFGEIVQKVGMDLFTYGSKPISMIMRSTELPRSQVCNNLHCLNGNNISVIFENKPVYLPDNAQW